MSIGCASLFEPSKDKEKQKRIERALAALVTLGSGGQRLHPDNSKKKDK